MSASFCKELPKIELHAHLNGSLSKQTLKQLGCLDHSVAEYQKLLEVIENTERNLESCFQLFKVAHNATNNIDSVYLATKSVIEDFADDNVIYIELRTTPRNENNMTKREYVEAVVKAIQDNDREIIVKLLLSLDRRNSLKDLQETLDIIIQQKKKHPDIIKGIDLSGDPAAGNFYSELFEKAKENGLFTSIHCAEIKNNEEVAMILKSRPDRIGHATCLHPNYGGTQENWDLYCKLKIPIECCLTSNVVSGTSKSYKTHHVQKWIVEGLPFCLNTDDKGIFNANLSDEFNHLYTNFELTETQMWELSVNAVKYSFASPEEKKYLISKLEVWRKSNILT